MNFSCKFRVKYKYIDSISFGQISFYPIRVVWWNICIYGWQHASTKTHAIFWGTFLAQFMSWVRSKIAKQTIYAKGQQVHFSTICAMQSLKNAKLLLMQVQIAPVASERCISDLI